MKVLVTGAEGFIGSHLVEELVRQGNTVRCLVMYNFSGSAGWLDELSSSTLANLEIVWGDLRDASQMAKLTENIEKVFHLAALIGIPYSYTASESYLQTNVQGTLNLLLAARSSGVTHFLQTSTSEVYGTAQTVPMSETHPLVAQSPYAASKIASDQLALSHWHSFGTPVTIVRPFNTYGPRQSNRAVVPSIISQALQTENGEISVGDITTSRDLSYVADTVSGFIAAAQSNQSVGKTFNLGTGESTKVEEIISSVGSLVGKNLIPVVSSERLRPSASEVRQLLSDNSFARKTLKWSPEYSGREGLRNGLAQTIEWWSERLKYGKRLGKDFRY